jgi:hypothetical protein
MGVSFYVPGFTILSVLVITIWWFLPIYQRKRLARGHPPIDRKDIATMEDEYRKTVTQALGGIFVVATLIIAYRQLSDARYATEAQLSSAQRNTDIQISASQFAKGFDLLGAATTAQRIGGIRILDDWINHSISGDGETIETKYNIVAPALLALIRNETAFTPDHTLCENFSRPSSVRIPDDVRAAFEVIRPWTRLIRSKLIHLEYLNLSEADLSGFDLDKVELSYSDLSGADLSNSSFKGSRLYCTNLYSANLRGSIFSSTSEKETVLAGALMINSDLSATSFIRANLRSANLSGANIDRANFSGADLFNTNFFRSSLISPIFNQETNISDACFVETNLQDAEVQKLKGASSALVIAPYYKGDYPKSHCFSQQKNGILVPDDN